MDIEHCGREKTKERKCLAPSHRPTLGCGLSLTVSTEKKVYQPWLSSNGTKAKLDNPGWLDSQLIWVGEKLTLRVGTVLAVDVAEDFRKDVLKEENQPQAQAAPFPPKAQSALSHGHFPKLTQYSHVSLLHSNHGS